MTRSLRARHRRTILIVAVLAGALLVAGLLARRPMPVLDRELATLIGE